ncbi:hypothetical protein PoB_000669800 [Plakobranchus ocellatus]|uniref:DUF19 domain-containing protein n=1 Tax=Plakobranchus ocellatus TaxID=259542 RepID=A0AAV3YCH0_9GAST|nr:hypothetical protein PoB_000669800 [Plakobranchus ocellatus]
MKLHVFLFCVFSCAFPSTEADRSQQMDQLHDTWLGAEAGETRQTATFFSGCLSLERCTHHIYFGTNGCFSFANLEAYPSTEAEWTTFWNNICNNKAATVACGEVQRDSCDDKSKIFDYYRAVNMMDVMCSDDGKAFYRRIYREERHCLGNRTKTALVKNKFCTCKSLFLPNESTEIINMNVCSLAKQSRDCIINFAGRLCSDLSKWLLDKYWIEIVHYQHPHCIRQFEAEAYPLPPERASERK